MLVQVRGRMAVTRYLARADVPSRERAVASRKPRLGGWVSTILMVVMLVGAATAGAVALVIPQASGLAGWIAMAVCLTGAVGARRVAVPGFVAGPLVIFVSMVLLAGVASLMTSTLEYALRGTYGLLAILGAAFTTAAYCAPRRGAASIVRQRAVVSVVVALSVLTAVWALRQSLLGFTAAELGSINRQESTRFVGMQVRSIGMFTISQEFGVFAGTVTPWLVVLAVRARGRRRWLLWAAVALLSAALLTSLTRTAILAALIASLVGIITNAPGRTPISRFLGGSAIALIVFGFGFFAMKSSSDTRVVDAVARIETLLNVGEDASFPARPDEVWWRGIHLMTEHPLGLGAGAAGPASSRFPEAAPFGRVVVDNGFIMVGVQLGWLGVAMFIWMLLALLIWLGRSTGTFARAGSMAILALLVAMIASQYWSLSAPGILVGSIIGLGISDAAARANLANSSASRPSAQVKTRP